MHRLLIDHHPVEAETDHSVLRRVAGGVHYIGGEELLELIAHYICTKVLYLKIEENRYLRGVHSSVAILLVKTVEQGSIPRRLIRCVPAYVEACGHLQRIAEKVSLQA